MAKRKRTKPKPVIGDANDPEGLYVWMRRYLEALAMKNYTERTVGNCEENLRLFLAWCEARSITRPTHVTPPMLERYRRHLFHLRRDNGKPLSFHAQRNRLAPLRGYFRWLTRQNVLLYNPASELELPRLVRRLPKHVLTEHEAELVLKQPDTNGPMGIRDRAILEVLYSTGIRRMELIGLQVFDLNRERGVLRVREGKGRRERIVPIGEQASAWIERYLSEVRPELVVYADEGTLFLSALGEALSAKWLTQIVHDYVERAELGKRGSCHLFRHTMATVMLENGADIRYIQEMLGHRDLSTTQIYTQVSIRRLKAIHALTHPTAKLHTREALRGKTRATAERPSVAKTTSNTDEDFSLLAAEYDEEAARDESAS
ncbi:MAG TPA: site-specific tyrosine recombinase XerC [Polyangiaceae bacterium]